MAKTSKLQFRICRHNQGVFIDGMLFSVHESVLDRLAAESETLYTKYGVYEYPLSDWAKTVIKGFRAQYEAYCDAMLAKKHGEEPIRLKALDK